MELMQQECSHSTACYMLLTLYSRSRAGTNRLYLDYFKEFLLLRDWLLSAANSAAMLRAESTPVAWFQRTYEVQELSKHLGIPESTVLRILTEVNTNGNRFSLRAS